MSKTFRAAIIGVGAIGSMHARAMRDVPNLKLVAGFTMVEAAGKKFATDNSCNYYGDYVELLEKEKPDFVTICTPSGAHLEPALAALERGVPVLCEKPIEIRLDRVDQMIAAAKKSGVMLGGIFPQRFNPANAPLLAAAKAGRFGNLACINAYVPWWRDDAYYGPGRWQGTLKFDGGGALMNQSIHSVDIMQWLAHAAMPELAPELNPVEQVFAYTGKRAHDPQRLEVEDTAVVVLRFRNGAMGQILAATSMFPGSLRRLQMSGRDGTVEIVEEQVTAWQFRTDLPEDIAIRAKFAADSKTQGGASDPMAIDCGHHTRNIAAFVSALAGESKLTIDGHESRKAVAIIQAVYESAASGKAVDVT